MSAHRLKWIEIDLQAVRSNIRWLRQKLAPQTQLMAVVKADAYGHGAGPVAKTAAKEGVCVFGVLTVAEGLELRRLGVRSRIIVLCPPLPEQAAEAVRAGLEPTIDSLALARALSTAARRQVPVHLDLDYGLGRWGIPPKELDGFLKKFAGFKRLRLAGLSTHVDYVPGKNAVEAEEKLRDFGRMAARARRSHPQISCHCANSAVLLDFPHRQMDMVRVGNLLYGINPTSKDVPLKDPFQFNARIIALKEVGKGRSIGYASEYLAPRHMTVATLPVGYADGLTMEPAERLIRLGAGLHYWGRLRGRKVPFVGRCGIAHVLVDVSSVPKPRLGEIVALPLRRTAASARLDRVYKA